MLQCVKQFHQQVTFRDVFPSFWAATDHVQAALLPEHTHSRKISTRGRLRSVPSTSVGLMHRWGWRVGRIAQLLVELTKERSLLLRESHV
jgi:hypothetical protein